MSKFCCLCSCSLSSFFTAAHFHLAFVQFLTPSIKFSCCSSNEIRLPCFLSLSLAFCRSFSRWALLPCRLLSRFLCLSLSLYSKICGHDNFHAFLEKGTAGIICQIWVVTRHQCGISAVVSQTSFMGHQMSGVVSGCIEPCKWVWERFYSSSQNLCKPSQRKDSYGIEQSRKCHNMPFIPICPFTSVLRTISNVLNLYLKRIFLD